MPNAIFSIFKPKGVSSFKVLSEVKKYFGTRKVGHMGTLDPLAEGILPVAVGKYTKLIPLINLSPKTYFVQIFFGISSETLDSEGVDLDNLPECELNFGILEVKKILDGMLGEFMQIPPLYSAIKVDGKRLYEYARSNQADALEIKSRKVELYSYSDLEISEQIVSFRVSCGNGFYVRSLVRDISEALDFPAFMCDLKRETVGPFNLDNVCLDTNFVSMQLEDLFDSAVVYELSDEEFKLVSNGNPIIVGESDHPRVIIKHQSQTVALGAVDNSQLKILRLFI